MVLYDMAKANSFLSRAVSEYTSNMYVVLIGHEVGSKNEVLNKKKGRKGKPWKGDGINHHHHHCQTVGKCNGHQRVFFSTAFIFWSFSSFIFVHSATFYLSRR